MVKSQRGNILFLILLAVVLFAALAYAVTSSMRGGGKDASSENVSVAASSLVQFFDTIDAAVMRMTMTGGQKIENISFEYNTKTYGGSASVAPTNINCTAMGVNTCKVFHTEGGGATALIFEKYAVAAPTGWPTTSSAPGYFYTDMMQWPQAGTSANDLVMFINAVKPEICAEVNRRLGINVAPAIAGTYQPIFDPANWDSGGRTISNNAAELTAKNTFAAPISGSGSGAYCQVYHLLYAR